MQNLNPFTRKTIQYHRAYKDSTDNGGDRSSDSVASPSPKEVDEEDVYLLAQPRHRPRLRHLCGYFFVALISLVLGLTLSQVFRVEYEVDGYTAPYGSPHHTLAKIVWELNSTFAAEPSAEDEKA